MHNYVTENYSAPRLGGLKCRHSITEKTMHSSFP